MSALCLCVSVVNHLVFHEAIVEHRPGRLPARLPGHLRHGRHRGGRPGGRAPRRPGPPLHPRLPLPEGVALSRPRLPPGPAAVPDEARRAEGRGAVRAHLAGTRRSDAIADAVHATIADVARRPAGDPAVQLRRHDGQAACTAASTAASSTASGASLLDRTICATAGAAGCDITLGTRAVIDPEAVRQLPLHHELGLEHARHEHRTSGRSMHAGPQGGRQDRHHRPVPESRRRPQSTGGCRSAPAPTRPWRSGMMHIIFRDGLQDQDYLTATASAATSCATGC